MEAEHSSDKVFVATPKLQQNGNFPIQTIGGKSQPLIVNSTPSIVPGEFLLNGVQIFRLGKVFCEHFFKLLVL